MSSSFPQRQFLINPNHIIHLTKHSVCVAGLNYSMVQEEQQQEQQQEC